MGQTEHEHTHLHFPGRNVNSLLTFIHQLADLIVTTYGTANSRKQFAGAQTTNSFLVSCVAEIAMVRR